MYAWARENHIITCERFRPEIQYSSTSPAATKKGKLDLVHRPSWVVAGPSDWFLDWRRTSATMMEGRIRHLAIYLGVMTEQSHVFASIADGKQNGLIDLAQSSNLVGSLMVPTAVAVKQVSAAA